MFYAGHFVGVPRHCERGRAERGNLNRDRLEILGTADVCVPKLQSWWDGQLVGSAVRCPQGNAVNAAPMASWQQLQIPCLPGRIVSLQHLNTASQLQTRTLQIPPPELPD